MKNICTVIISSVIVWAISGKEISLGSIVAMILYVYFNNHKKQKPRKNTNAGETI